MLGGIRQHLEAAIPEQCEMECHAIGRSPPDGGHPDATE